MATGTNHNPFPATQSTAGPESPPPLNLRSLRGGTSSAGAYSVSGTIGQANTGVASGGAFTVISGFWPGIEAESGVLPRLDIRWESNHVVLSWPHSSPGYLLQEGVPGEWSDVTEPAVRVGDDNELTVSITTTHRFFRLRKL